MLSGRRDLAAARRFFKQAIGTNRVPDRVLIDKGGTNLAGIKSMNVILKFTSTGRFSMAQRVNGRIDQVLQSYHFGSGDKPGAMLRRYVWLYNQQFSQSALGCKSPLQPMKDWYKL